MAKYPKLTIRISEDLREQFNRATARSHTTVSHAIRDFIIDYVKRNNDDEAAYLEFLKHKARDLKASNEGISNESKI